MNFLEEEIAEIELNIKGCEFDIKARLREISSLKDNIEFRKTHKDLLEIKLQRKKELLEKSRD